MNNYNKYFLVFFYLSAFFAVPLLCLPAQAGSAADTTNFNPEKIFYLAKYNVAAGIESVNKNWDKIDILAPQMYVVQANFTISGGFGPKLKKAIKDHNLKVMPLIANAGFNQKIIHNLLTSETSQNKVINALISVAKIQKYIGWQFDFENINYQDRDLFTGFMQKAYPIFKKNNLILSVVAVPRTSDYENTDAFKNWSGAYDYKAIAENCDFVSLMAYDDPNSSGPVASIGFVNNVLSYVKDKIPAEKLSLGAPLYYWKWNADTDKKIGSGLFKNILAIMSNFRYILNFDPSLGVSCLTYTYGTKNYKVWFEDKNSFEAKLNIIKDNNLRGFSAWLLGGEDPKIWSVLNKNTE
jgi:spore germination protein YaaH